MIFHGIPNVVRKKTFDLKEAAKISTKLKKKSVWLVKVNLNSTFYVFVHLDPLFLVHYKNNTATFYRNHCVDVPKCKRFCIRMGTYKKGSRTYKRCAEYGKKCEHKKKCTRQLCTKTCTKKCKVWIFFCHHHGCKTVCQ